MTRLTLRVISTCALVCIMSGCEAYFRVVAQRQQARQTADRLLSLGNFYSKNNDITDAADRYYKQVITNYPDSRQSGLAQHNRGAYWHGKYNILRQNRGEKDRMVKSALLEAEAQYVDFIDKFAEKTGTIDWLSDGEFNLALVYLQKNDRKAAIGWLYMLLRDSNRDKEIYVYRIVWSPSAADVIDRNFNSTELGEYALSVFKREDYSAVQIISQLKQWCRNH